jgi:hypothetical protein
VRLCPDCGANEERVFIEGKEWINLDPVSGRCVPCLTRMVKAKPMPGAALPRDVKLAQLPAHDDED